MAQRKIDWFKYAGIAAAIAVLVGSQVYFSRVDQRRHAQYLREKEARDAKLKEEEERRKREEAAKPAPREIEDDGEAAIGPPENGEKPPAEKPPKETPKAAEKPKPAKETEDVVVSNGQLELTFASKGGALRKARLTKFKLTAETPENEKGLDLLDEVDPGKRSLALSRFTWGEAEFNDLESRVWELSADSKGFTGRDGAYELVYSTTLHENEPPYKPLCRVAKRFLIAEDNLHTDLEITVTNLTDQEETYSYILRGAAGVLMDGPPEDPKQGAYTAFIKSSLAARDDSGDEPSITLVDVEAAKAGDEDNRRVSRKQNLWASVHNRFFMAALVSRDPLLAIKIVDEPIRPGLRSDKLDDKRYQEQNITPLLYRRESAGLEPDASSAAESFAFYMGPAQQSLLESYEQKLELPAPIEMHLSVQYCDIGIGWGWRWPRVDWLSRWLLWGFTAFANLTGSYGLAVILLTIAIKMVLHPLQRKQYISMHKMQALAPEMKALQAKYEGQTSPEARQRMTMEQMDLYKKAGANPFTGCLPMFIQMPIFFALYGTFSHAFEIRQAPFLWVPDLSLQDATFALPFWPGSFNILPILYMAMTLGQTLMQPKPASADPQQEMQRKMFMAMPIFFGFILYRMPSGLLLYFAVSSAFGIVESLYIKKVLIPRMGSNGAMPATDGLKQAKGKVISESPIPGVTTKK